jgi:alginate O-acetyltransferase complex protein AlgI
MVFSSLLFLFRFLAVALPIYYLAPKKLKNAVLLILSLCFYAWGEVRYLPIMFASILVDYGCGQGIKRFGENKRLRKLFLLCSMVFNLGMLFFFKYTGFFLQNIGALTGLSMPDFSPTLPLGISFYTFQTMSYTIDVYRGDVEPEDNIITFGAYVTLFPQLIAGPIVRYADVAAELKDRRITLSQIETGARLFILGLGSKVLIANNVGQIWDTTLALPLSDISTPMAWIAALAYSLQIYFDFSGYSLMAIGLGHMLGFHFPQNFNYPYVSGSITEFWRRWHMTLSGWFREYVYFPLGGSRCSNGKRIRNLLIVWALTGLWHGASWNFVLWGLWFFVLLVIEKQGLLDFYKRHKVIAHIIVPILLMISWVIFKISDFSLLGGFLGRMFGVGGFTSAGNPLDWLYALRGNGLILLIGVVFSLPVLRNGHEKLVGRFGETKALQAVETVLLGVVLILSVAYLVDSTYNPFIYWNF